jgi:hypothetical protein
VRGGICGGDIGVGGVGGWFDGVKIFVCRVKVLLDGCLDCIWRLKNTKDTA